MALTNRQFEKILQEYDETRQENERAARARYEEACEKIPALRKLDGEIAKTGSEAAQYAVTHGEVMPDFSDRMNALSDRRARLLTDAGYPADYTEIRYRCPLCRDTGFADGRKCTCLLSKEAALLRENYNADSLFADSVSFREARALLQNGSRRTKYRPDPSGCAPSDLCIQRAHAGKLRRPAAYGPCIRI